MSAPTVGPMEAAIIVPAAASLQHMLTDAAGWPDKLRDPLKRIAAWSQEYARTSRVDHLHWVMDAELDLREWVRGHPAYINLAAAPAIQKAYELATFVRAVGRPAPVSTEVFDAIDRAASAGAGVTVEAWRAELDEEAARWRSRLVVALVGVDTDTPTLEGIDHLTTTQLRHIHRQVARLINANTPPPTRPSKSARPVEQPALPLGSTGQRVA